MIYPDIKRSFVKTIIKKETKPYRGDEKRRLIDRLKECFEDVMSKEENNILQAIQSLIFLL